MATFIAKATNKTGSGNPDSISVSVPTGTQDGDVMIAAVYADFDTNGAESTGWTEILTIAEEPFIAARMFYRVASSEPSSYTWTRDNTAQDFGFGVGHFTFRDVDTSGGSPIDVAQKGTDPSPDGSLTMPSVSTSGTASILTFCAAYRGSGTLVLFSSFDAGTELDDQGVDEGNFLVYSGALYHKADVDQGTHGYHVDLSGNMVDVTAAFFTVALKGSGITGTSTITAPTARFSSDGGPFNQGTIGLTAPAASVAVEAVTDLAYGPLSITAPLASFFAATDSTVSASAAITVAPVASFVGHHDAAGTVDITVPKVKLLMGAETRIFGARIVVVRAETRVRHPF